VCGRYTVSGSDIDGLRQRFGLDERVVVRQRFNVAPGDDVLAVTPDGGTELRWGYLKDNAYTTINARAESLLEKPTWRNALHDGRCLIVADGFFEWQKLPDGRKQPYWITRADHAPFAFAGLASPWGTCAIVTTAAAPNISELHDRMPVMLDQDSEEAWLSPGTSTEDAFALLRPYERTTTLAVSGAVNDARYDGPECLTPAPPPPETLF
jgi:putative SOS response-associated peptidase YedK